MHMRIRIMCAVYFLTNIYMLWYYEVVHRKEQTWIFVTYNSLRIVS